MTERAYDESLRGTVQELAWRFHAAEAAIGIRAQSAVPVKNYQVFDDLASHEAHMRLRDRKHRWAVSRMAVVDSTLSAVSEEARAAIRLAFTPGGRADSRVSRFFEIRVSPFTSDYEGQSVSILAFALRSHAMRMAWAVHHESVVMPDQDQLLDLLTTTKNNDVLKTVFAGAMAELRPHLKEYDRARQARIALEIEEQERKRRAREELCEVELVRLREKLWGKP